MRHWKRLIKIPGGTDCSYYINNMTCPIHVSYCLVALVTIPDHLSLIMLHVYFVTLPDTCYTFCCGTLPMHGYTLPCIYSALCISCRLHTLQTSLLYMPNAVVWLCCICTSACSFPSRRHYIYYCRHDPMITC